MKKLLAIVMMALPMMAGAQDNNISKSYDLANKRGKYLLSSVIYYNENLFPIDTVYVLAACDEYDYYAPSFPAMSGLAPDMLALLDKLIEICDNPNLEGVTSEENDRTFTRCKDKISIKYYDGRSKIFSRKDLQMFKDKIVEFINSGK